MTKEKGELSQRPLGDPHFPPHPPPPNIFYEEIETQRHERTHPAHTELTKVVHGREHFLSVYSVPVTVLGLTLLLPYFIILLLQVMKKADKCHRPCLKSQPVSRGAPPAPAQGLSLRPQCPPHPLGRSGSEQCPGDPQLLPEVPCVCTLISTPTMPGNPPGPAGPWGIYSGHAEKLPPPSVYPTTFF